MKSTSIRKILVPIDFSRRSLPAIPCALAVARNFGAETHLLHVIDTTQHSSKSLMLRLISPAELTRPLTKQLKAVALRYGAAGKIHVLKPREGRAYEEICAAALQLKADLIVITTHGYTGFKRALLGSTAERVVQHSPCPVFVTRQEKRKSETSLVFTAETILVPVDFSDSSLDGLNYAIQFADRIAAKLILLHAVHLAAYIGGGYAYDLSSLEEAVRKDAQRQMHWFETCLDRQHGGTCGATCALFRSGRAIASSDQSGEPGKSGRPQDARPGEPAATTKIIER